MNNRWRRGANMMILVLLLAACGTGGTNEPTATPEESSPPESPAGSEPAASEPTAASDCGVEALGGEAVPVEFQLQWFAQAQFAGYYAAKDLGFYDDAGLDVTILEGGGGHLPAAGCSRT